MLVEAKHMNESLCRCIVNLCPFFCSFNRFEFPPIFHRDEDTNLDELRVYAFTLRRNFGINCNNYSCLLQVPVCNPLEC